MAEVVGIRFKEVGKVYYFDPDGKTFEKGDRAIVETARCGPRRREGKAGLHGLRAAAAAGPMRRSTPGSSRSWTRGTARFRR